MDAPHRSAFLMPSVSPMLPTSSMMIQVTSKLNFPGAVVAENGDKLGELLSMRARAVIVNVGM